MRIVNIKGDAQLANYLGDTCCENGICVNFENDVNKNNIAIVKVDQFYNSQHMAHTPPSVDCLIMQKCLAGGYNIILAELKKTANEDYIRIENIVEKFTTTLNNFMQNRFQNHYDIDYKSMKLYFVSNIEISDRDASLKMDSLINTVFTFRKKRTLIRFFLPNPAIANCQ